MSSTRVVVGTDDRGRPRSEWRPTPGVDAEPRYGHMEPAHTSPIERRKATPDELAAARAREEEPHHLVAPTLSSPGVIVQRAPALQPIETPEEEPPVPESSTNIPETLPEATREPTLDPHALLDRLAVAAVDARVAREEKEAADTAWDVAREALARAYGEVEWLVEPLPLVPAYDAPMPSAALDADSEVLEHVAPEPIGGGPVRSRSGEGQRPGQASARDRRAVAVMAAMGRLNDDMGAVAAELGMKKNAVAQVVKFARKRAEVGA